MINITITQGIKKEKLSYTTLQRNNFIYICLMLRSKLQILQSVFQYLMDKFTKNYIDDIVKPLLHRIETLQRSNTQLQVQVKYLQSLIGNNSNGTYQKPTISAANHMRDSRISSKGEASSVEKRPGWNSKTKVEQSPAANNKEPVHHEKLKTKPPIPKLMKSPNKNDPHEDMRSSALDKKITGSVKCQADNSQKKIGVEAAQVSPVKSETNHIQPRQNNQQKSLQVNLGQVRDKVPIVGAGINATFEQLVKNNTEILTSMKDSSPVQKQAPKVTLQTSPSNYVQKANSPKSEYNQSQTTSPNERSFASQANPLEKTTAKPLDGMKINLDCNMAKIELK